MIIDTNDSFSRPNRGPRIGQRHVLVILSSLCVTVVSYMHSTLRVSIIAVVNASAVEQQEGERLDPIHCPISVNQTDFEDGLGASGTFLWSHNVQNLIYGSHQWGCLLLQLLAAALAQRFGGKCLILCAVVWMAVLTGITPLIAPISPFYVVAFQILIGVGEGMVLPSILAMLGRWIPRAEANFLTILIFCGNTFGMVVGQLATGPLCLTPWGWPTSFCVSAFAAAMWCFLWAVFAADSPEKDPRITNEELLYITLHVGKGLQARCNSQGAPWRDILADRAVWACVVSLSAHSWIFYTALTSFPKYMSEVLHMKDRTYGFQAALPLLASIPLLIITSYIFDLMAHSFCRSAFIRKGLNFFGYFGIAGCLFAFTRTTCNVLFAEIMHGVIICLLALIVLAVIPNFLELSPAFCGSLFALANTFATAGVIFEPFVFDSLTSHATLQEWNTVFYISITVSLFSGIIFTLLASTDNREWNPRGLDCPLISDMSSINSEVNLAI